MILYKVGLVSVRNQGQMDTSQSDGNRLTFPFEWLKKKRKKNLRYGNLERTGIRNKQKNQAPLLMEDKEIFQKKN